MTRSLPEPPDRRIAVAIMAKRPQAGEVKTRLLPALPAAEIAGLYEQFLLDKMAQVRALAGAQPVVAFTPEDARAVFERMAPDFALLAQQGHDLGRRLLNGIRDLLADGYAGALMVDSDTPTLPVAYLQRGVDLLMSGGADIVLGPTEDGGYYLIGMRHAYPDLFTDMPWSTDRLLLETLRRAERAGLTTTCLPPWFDVDTPEDLRRLEDAMAHSGTVAHNTAAFLARIASAHRVAGGPR
jgi:rSAM/selenodomain-associated transferase 1